MKPASKKNVSRIRIIGGYWRSRLLKVADQPGLRPSTDRVRETLFNWLGQDLDGLKCLDMFAGTGALGFEALSRGAQEVVFIENNPVVHQMLQTNLKDLGELPEGSHAQIVKADALIWLKKQQLMQFDIVFIDPPFADLQTFEKSLIAITQSLNLSKSTAIYVECASEVSNDVLLSHLPGWQIYRQMMAGAVKATLLRLE